MYKLSKNKLRSANQLIPFFRSLFLLLAITLAPHKAKSCTPIPIPTLIGYTITGTTFSISVSNTNQWTNCTNFIDVEFACINASFGGLASATFTSPSFISASNYVVPTFGFSIASLCSGSGYKFRWRERNNQGFSPWSSAVTFTTGGTVATPTLALSAFPNIICPPASNQLSVTVLGNCGATALSYIWSPATGLNNPNIANPIATVTNNITYTVTVSGGQLGCWTATDVITLNVGTSPPVGGTATALPASICLGKTSTLSVTGFSGNIQWQSSSNSNGPWANVAGAVNTVYITPPINTPVCYRVLVGSCSGTVFATSNTVCINTNLTPVVSTMAGCTNTLFTAAFTYTGSSGAHTSVAWSPAPLTTAASSTQVQYALSGTKTFTAFFPDGCIASGTVVIPQPSLSFVTNSISCASLGTATVYPSNMPGPYNYNWAPTPQTGSVATGLFPNVYNVTANFSNGNCVYSQTVNFPSSNQFYGTVNNTFMLDCNSAANGTADITVTGGTGGYNYNWTNGSAIWTTPSVSTLPAGTYTVYISDQVTFCSTYQVFLVLQPPPLGVTVTAASPTACAGKSTTINAMASGGTGTSYTYSWTNGPATSSILATQAAAGAHIYTVIAYDANNCPAATNAIINFIANPVISISNAFVCPGETGSLTASGATSYTWTGNVTSALFTAAPLANTLYTVIGSAQTCTSVGSASIIMKPVPTATISSNSPVCNGGLLILSALGGTAYAWSGPAGFITTGQSAAINLVNAGNAGNYTVIATAANSCTDDAVVNVVINPTPPVSANGSTVCSNQLMTLSANSGTGTTYLWSGPFGFASNQQNPSVNNPVSGIHSGNYTVKVTSALGCTNTAIANVTVTTLPILTAVNNGPKCDGAALNLNGSGISGGSYSWNGPAGFISTQQNPVINQVGLTATGIYNYYVTLGPCIASATTAVLINPLPNPIINSNSPVCESKDLNLSVSAANILSYVWQGPAGFSSSSGITGRSGCSIHYSGMYSVLVVDVNSCAASTSASITIHANPTISAVSSTVCYKSPAILKGEGGVNYWWYNPYGFYASQTNALIPSASNTSAVVYTVVGAALNSCTSTATATLNTLPLPKPYLTVKPSDNRICVNQVLTFSGFGAFGYDWAGPGQFRFAGQTASFVVGNTSFTGTYTLTAKDINGCMGTASTSVQVYDLPLGNLDGLMKGCVPLCSNFIFYPASSSSSIVSTSFLLANRTFTNSKFAYCFNTPGDYVVKGILTDDNGCVNTSTYLVNAYPLPRPDFTIHPEKPIERLDEVMFENVTAREEKLNSWAWYAWDNELFGANKTMAGRLFEDAGTYPVAMVAKNVFGCSDTIVKLVKISEDFNLFVPTAFSPNGDGLNDVFLPVTRGVKNYDMKIFNRWGQLLFSTSNAANGWDGLFKGKDCEVGVYTWKITANSIRGEIKEMTGHVMVFR